MKLKSAKYIIKVFDKDTLKEKATKKVNDFEKCIEEIKKIRKEKDLYILFAVHVCKQQS